MGAENNSALRTAWQSASTEALQLNVVVRTRRCVSASAISVS